MTTIRQALDTLGGIDRVENRAGEDALDLDAEVSLTSTPGTGALQVSCGGTCVATFRPAKTTRRNLYLVVDDSHGRAWDHDPRPMYERTPHYRPHERLVLVQSA